MNAETGKYYIISKFKQIKIVTKIIIKPYSDLKVVMTIKMKLYRIFG